MTRPVAIYYDLETTGLDADAEILQIAAKTRSNGRENVFNRYLFPEAEITSGATSVNGLTKFNGQLYKNGHVVIKF